ncbi:monovalent cation:proton antiporter family protein [Desulfolutivibrio sulfoxidireducens]|uniref:monovalent cation:proton antiporter family protein n=1 Tax=Desulfolutivibrio sulfoxidireducens TaxID=2773299 RepID=UPI00159D6B57|nr:monovalent cation:proton antiporter family protein [Desulfolutivibrio sulfoxidireducens]QLA17652.1 potassium transporter KefB [Desulfolutivibrio sulfoxidireducens]
MEFALLNEIVVIFCLSIGVIFLCHKIRVPAIVGFLLTGVLAGPHGLGLVDSVHEVEMVAEIGVILLLFTIGLELSISELIKLRKPVFIGGAAQVLLTILVFAGAGAWLGLTPGQAVFAGFLTALSSTAIVLKLLQERAEVESPHGRIILSILIFQDLIIVPMMLLVPFLSGQSQAESSSLLLTSVKGFGVVILVFFLARKIVPRILLAVMRTRSKELFLLTTLGICMSVAFLTASLGLSLSLGAFLAGLIISESEYSLSAMEGILPFRDVFTSLFFISVGMLLNTAYFFSHADTVLLVTAAVLVLKTVLAAAAARILGYPLRPAVLVGLCICQVGEFSFILAKTGLAGNLIGQDHYQLFLSASILTMLVTPFCIMFAPALADRLGRLPLLKAAAAPYRGPAEEDGQHRELSDHLIICGFGIGGRHLARAAKAAGIDYTILEMNPDTVRTQAAKGQPIAYGDATHPAVLEHAGIHKARVLAIVVSDPVAVRRITDTARKTNPSVHIIVRTRFVNEIGPLRELGANDVIPEEFETSIEIFTRVMTKYMVPRMDIERFVDEVRSESYEMLRNLEIRGEPMAALAHGFTGIDVSALTVEEGSMLDGRTLEESELRRTHGLTVVAVGRGGQIFPNPDGTMRFAAGDVAYVFGPHADITAKAGLFTSRRRSWEAPA